MPPVQPCPLPASALLQRYAGGQGYTDCFFSDVPRAVPHAAFVAAFYTSAVFRLERWLIALLAGRPSTDAQARQLGQGALDAFSAWTVEARADNQLLMADRSGRTRSWLMVAPSEAPDGGTRLFFGSAVVPVVHRATGRPALGAAFTALLGFHKLYSKLLLRAAASRLMRATPDTRRPS